MREREGERGRKLQLPVQSRGLCSDTNISSESPLPHQTTERKCQDNLPHPSQCSTGQEHQPDAIWSVCSRRDDILTPFVKKPKPYAWLPELEQSSVWGGGYTHSDHSGHTHSDHSGQPLGPCVFTGFDGSHWFRLV